MRIVLLLIGLLFPVAASAEEIQVFDQECIAQNVRMCLAEFTGQNKILCAAGSLPVVDASAKQNACLSVMSPNSVQGWSTRSVQGWSETVPDQSLNMTIQRIEFCEKVVYATVASLHCLKKLNIPSAAQLDTFNDNFNKHFIEALGRAFPGKSAASSSPATPAPTPAPTPIPAKP